MLKSTNKDSKRKKGTTKQQKQQNGNKKFLSDTNYFNDGLNSNKKTVIKFIFLEVLTISYL